jgi:hypothetical protein
VRRNAHHFHMRDMPPSRTNSVNIDAEFELVAAAAIEKPMSHHGIDLPERKKSLASRPARREQAAAIPNISAKNSAMTTKSIPFKSMGV